MTRAWFHPDSTEPDHLVAWIRSARRAWPRVRIPFGGSTIVLVALAVGLSYDAGPPSMSPARRAVLMEGEGVVKALAFMRGGGLVAANNGRGLCLWKVDLYDRCELQGPLVEGDDVALSSDGALLAVGADSTVTLWDTAANARRIEILTHTGLTRALAFSRDGKTLAVAGPQSLSVRDTTTGYELVGVVPTLPGVTSLAFSPDGRALATGDTDGCVRIWDLTKRLQRAVVRAHNTRVSCLRFSSDGGKLVSASLPDFVLRIWDAATCRPVASLRGHLASVQTAEFSPDGRILATAAMPAGLRLWDSVTGRQLAVLQGNDDAVRAIAFSPDGRTLAAGGVGQTIWMWDMARLAASPPVSRPGS